MRIDALTLEGFRNYDRQALTFHHSCNVIYGENAQGKTNLLEAMVYLSCGKSPRARADRELIGFDRDKARIMVAIVDWNTRREVGSGTEAPTGTWDPEETTSVDEGPIIAYGSLFIDQSSTGGKMIDVQLPLNFYDTKAKPSGLYQIVISCSTSAYGDFMAGCKSNILYVDNFEWVY